MPHGVEWQTSSTIRNQLIFQYRRFGSVVPAVLHAPAASSSLSNMPSRLRLQSKAKSKLQDAREAYQERLPAPARRAIAVGGRVGAGYLALRMLLAGWRSIKRRTLRHMLKHIVPALEQAGATFWVDMGTLMGLYKYNDVMEFDNDVDLVVLNPDFDKLLLVLPKLLPKGYTVDWVGKQRDLGDGLSQRWLRVYAPSRLIWADLFGAWPKGDMIRINKNTHCDVPKALVQPLGHVHLFDSVAPAPRDVEGVLRHRYGEDWRGPPKYASKGRDSVEHNKPYLRFLRAMGAMGLKI